MASNPNTMTLDEARDWLAEHTPRMERGHGYWCMDRTAHVMHPMHRVFAPGTLGLGHIFWYASKEDHPYPPTLDGAAGAMPDGWYYWINHCALNGQEVFACRAVNKQICTRSAETEAPTEILARYRLAVAVRMAQKEQA